MSSLHRRVSLLETHRNNLLRISFLRLSYRLPFSPQSEQPFLSCKISVPPSPPFDSKPLLSVSQHTMY